MEICREMIGALKEMHQSSVIKNMERKRQKFSKLKELCLKPP